VTNSLKYATFPAKGSIHITLYQQKEGYRLSIKDNGITKPLSYEKEGSIGTDLIIGLAKSKLKGSSRIFYDKGTHIEVQFKGQ
jgi:two-component sensor histidine kinase